MNSKSEQPTSDSAVQHDAVAYENGTSSELSGDRQASREQHLEDRIHHVLEQKLISLLDNESTNREILWLRRQVNWSIGVLVVLILAMGGVFTWFSYRLQTQLQSTEGSAATTAIAPSESQLSALSDQINALNERLPENLEATLTNNQQQLQSLSEQLNTLSTEVTSNQQTLTEMEQSVQELNEAMLLNEDDATSGATDPNTSSGSR